MIVPPASPARVVRAVLLSDTNPPLYYLLFYGWTLIFGTSDMALRLFSTACSLACLPLLVMIARRTAGTGSGAGGLRSFCLLTAGDLLFGRRSHVLAPVAVPACDYLGFARNATTRRRRRCLFVLWILISGAGFLTHYFFVFPWLAIVAYLSLRPGKLKRLHLAVCVLATALLILPWYVRLPESLAGWRITKDWLKSRPPHFSLLVVLRDNVFQFFSGHERHLWEGCRISSIVAFMLFAAVAALALWRRRLRVLSRDRLLLALVFAAACAGPFAFDVLQHTYTIAWPRYAISALPAAYLLAAAGLACLRPRTRIIMLSLIVLAWTPNLVIMNQDPSHWNSIREISRTVSANVPSLRFDSRPFHSFWCAWRCAIRGAALRGWLHGLDNLETAGCQNRCSNWLLVENEFYS